MENLPPEAADEGMKGTSLLQGLPMAQTEGELAQREGKATMWITASRDSKQCAVDSAACQSVS